MIGKVFGTSGTEILKDYIHTALKVKSETNLSFQAVLIGVTPRYFTESL